MAVVTWNTPPVGFNANAPSVTNGNLTVTTVSGGGPNVLITTVGFSAGSLYFEIEGTTLGTTEWGVGWGPYPTSNYDGNPPGFYSNGLLIYRNGSQVLTGNNGSGSIGTVPGMGSAPAYMGIAFVPSSGKIWGTTNGTTWNAGGGASPGGTGGYTGSGSGWVAPFAPIIYVGEFSNGPLSFTANFGATPFQFPIPLGFTPVGNTTPAIGSSPGFFFAA
jgi:hypothetical protein